MSSPTDPGARGLALWREAALVVAAPLLLYLLLGRNGFYEVDGQSLVHWLAVGDGNHDRHMLFLPLARWIAAPMLALGMTPFQALRAVSAIGMAVAVLLFWAAALRLGYARSHRLLLAVAIASSPSLLFFSSIVEFHGLFLAFAALAWWCEASLEATERPLRWGLVLGVATGIAALVHGTGQLLGVLLPVFYLVRRRASAPLCPRDYCAAGLAFSCHLLVVLVLGFSLRPEGAMGQEDYIQLALANLPPVLEWGSDLAFEWILAFLPVSLICWYALGSRTLRPQASWLLLSVLLYVSLSWLLIPGMHERGAYLLPLVYPAALQSLSLPRRWPLILMTLIGLVYGVQDLRSVEMSAGSETWSEALMKVEAEQAGFYFLGEQKEIDALLIRAPNLPYDHFENTVVLLKLGDVDPTQVSTLLMALAGMQQKRGRTLYMTDSAWELLVVSDATLEAMRKAIESTFRMDRVERTGFTGWRLENR